MTITDRVFIEPIRIMLFLDPQHSMRSSKRILDLFAGGLKDKGHIIILCCHNRGGLAQEMRPKGFRVVELTKNKLYSFEAIRSFIKLIRLIREEKVNIILSFQKACDYAGFLLSLAARIPIVFSPLDGEVQPNKRYLSLYRLVNLVFGVATVVSKATKNSTLKTDKTGACNLSVINNVATSTEMWNETEPDFEHMVDKYEDLLRYACIKWNAGKRDVLLLKIKKFKSACRRFVKVCVAFSAYYGGLVWTYSFIKRIFRIGRPKILCFHDISMFSNTRKQHGLSIEPKSFDKLLEFMSENYDVLNLKEVIKFIEAKQPRADDVFALTFDDYYKGWIKWVQPTCNRLNMPYTVFVNTYPLTSGLPVLHDALFFIVENTWRKVIDLSRWGLGVFLLNNSDNILKCINNIIGKWRGSNFGEQLKFLKELAGYLEVSLNPEQFEDIIITWEEIIRLDKSGVTIGAHTESHALLTALTKEECRFEIKKNKEYLQEKLGHPIRFFSYPYGDSESYNRAVISMLEDAGFSNAFTLLLSNNNEYRPFEIGRRNITPGDFTKSNGNISKPLLSLELSGLGDILFGRNFRKKQY